MGCIGCYGVDWTTSILLFVEDVVKGGIGGVMIVIPCLKELLPRSAIVAAVLCKTQICVSDVKHNLLHIQHFVPGQFTADQCGEQYIN